MKASQAVAAAATLLKPACAVGEHTNAILEELGYTAEERDALAADGVVLQHVPDRARATAEVS